MALGHCSVRAGRPMDVSVLYKRGQLRPHSAVKASVLGGGLLERARSTSLALLGMTAAVGLAMVALALNQGWPLIAGAPIPGLGNTHQAVGDATIAARATTRSVPARAPQGSTKRRADRVLTPAAKKGAGETVAAIGAQHAQPQGAAVTDPAQVDQPSVPSGGPAPSPAAAAPQPVAAPTPSPTPAPVSEPASSPSASPPVTAQVTPEPTTSSTPVVSSDDEDSGHDRGHHYGRGTGRSHPHPRGGDDSDGSEVTETTEPAPSAPPTPLPSSEPVEEPESTESHSPAWTHGGGHSYGHRHGHW